MNKIEAPYLELLILLRKWNQEWIAYDTQHSKLKPIEALKLIEELKNKFNISFKNE